MFAQSEPLEFKGIVLGSNIASIESNPRFSGKNSDIPIADQICNLRYGETETMAGAPVEGLWLSFYGGVLHTITIHFDAKNFSQVTDALNEKYGMGTLKTEAVQNRMGATFENRIYRWDRTGASLEARRVAGKIDRSSVMFRTDVALDEFKRRRGSSAKQQAKDL